MKIDLSLVYLSCQLVTVLFLGAEFLVAKEKKPIVRSLFLFAAILSLFLLYLSACEQVTLPLEIYLGVNALVFLVYGVDKLLAVRGSGSRRVSENSLILLAAAGIYGAIGGMLVFHHKNKKAKLQYTIPVIAVVETILLYLLLVKERALQLPDTIPAAVVYVTIVTTLILCFVLVKTFILIRIPLFVGIALTAATGVVRMLVEADSASMFACLKAKPGYFLGIAAAVFIVLEILAVTSRQFTTGNQVRMKTDHSGDK